MSRSLERLIRGVALIMLATAFYWLWRGSVADAAVCLTCNCMLRLGLIEART